MEYFELKSISPFLEEIHHLTNKITENKLTSKDITPLHTLQVIAKYYFEHKNDPPIDFYDLIPHNHKIENSVYRSIKDTSSAKYEIKILDDDSKNEYDPLESYFQLAKIIDGLEMEKNKKNKLATSVEENIKPKSTLETNWISHFNDSSHKITVPPNFYISGADSDSDIDLNFNIDSDDDEKIFDQHEIENDKKVFFIKMTELNEYHDISKKPRSAEILYQLGKCYELGRGTMEDHTKAKCFYYDAAELNHPIALKRMGDFFSEEKDFNHAFEYYQKALEQKYYRAYLNLGNYYQAGLGVKQDLSLAIKNYTEAINKNIFNGYYKLAMIYLDNEPQKATELLIVGAVNGDSDSQYQLGCCYEDGIGITTDINLAYLWYYLAAKGDGNNNNARYRLGYISEMDEFPFRNATLAFRWYSSAAYNDDPNALFELAQCYEYASGCKKSFSKARELYRLACKFGHQKAGKWLLKDKVSLKSDKIIACIKDTSDADELKILSELPQFIKKTKNNKMYQNLLLVRTKQLKNKIIQSH